MPFDGFMTGYLCTELNNNLQNAKINKIYQPNAYDILLEIYAPEYKNANLRISAAGSYANVSLTKLSYDNPQTPPAFCMLLRKHLLGGKIKSVSQNLHDRIITFNIEQADEIGDLRTRYLIAELTGRNSNIILTDESLVIIDCIKKVDESKSSVRNVLPKLKYTLPPSDKLNPSSMRENEFATAIKSVSLPPDKAIVRVIDGASSAYAKQILSDIDNESDKSLFDKIKNSLISPDEYYIFEKNNSYIDIYFSDLYRDDYLVTKHSYKSILTLCADYYDNIITRSKLSEKENYVKSIINPLIKKSGDKLKKLNRELAQCANKETFNRYGQLLLTYGYDIKQGSPDYEAADIFDENNQIIKIPLDTNLTAYENAERYFKKYKKLKNAEQHLLTQINLTNNELDFLSDQLYYINECKTVEDVEEVIGLLANEGYIKKSHTKQAQAVSTPHHFISSDGFDIYVGKNDKQNEYLTHKFAKKQDIWLHTKIIAGSHVIIKTNSKQVPKNTLLEAAQLSAFFSKARSSQNVPVDYTNIAYVRKIRNAPAGKVTYTHYTTLYVTPDEVLIKSLKTM